MAVGRYGETQGDVGPSFIAFLVVNALLLPYAKLVWDEARGFVLGDNVFFVSQGLMQFVGLKVVVNRMLWAFAILIAPIGLAYLMVRR
ncbi:MAG: hypothetical protein QM679_07605 [Patulibacter sp.]